MQRRFEHRPAQISFTSDFHELLEGDLRPGASLTLRYDPDRLSPPPEYTFADPRCPVLAHVQYVEHGALRDLPLTGPVTPLPDRDPMGQGSMLIATTVVPADATFVELWFSGQMPDGERWDSDYGTNYWFRFPYLDIEIASAEVIAEGDTDARFRLRVRTTADVEAVRVRFSDVSTPVRVRRDEPLRADEATGPLRREWSFEGAVAPTALIRFKLYYWLGGRRYKDDNSGQYYIASRPDLREEVPPPPAALIAAAHAWSEKLKSTAGQRT